MATKKSAKAKKKTAKKSAAKKKTAAKNRSAKKTTAKKKTAKKPVSGSAKKAVKNKTLSKKTAKALSKVSSQKKKKKKTSTLRDKKVMLIRDRLLEQKNQLLSEAESALGQLPGQILFPDMGDQASAEIDRNFMLRLRGREQKLLKKIDGVLESIESGSYGICETCGAEIGIERLEARPVTSLCIECKTEQEEEERLRE